MRSGASSGAVAWAPFTWRVIFASTDLLINLSLNVRFTLGTKAEVVQTESREPTRRSLGTLVMAASGLCLLGVSFLLLARRPFRMPPGERLFRVVWASATGPLVCELFLTQRHAGILRKNRSGTGARACECEYRFDRARRCAGCGRDDHTDRSDAFSRGPRRSARALARRGKHIA